MVRRSAPADSEALRQKLLTLLSSFEEQLGSQDIRGKVRALIPVNFYLRDLGSSLLPNGSEISARARILSYMRRFPGTVIDGDELMVVAGISEYARRIRELRVQEGWPILSGATANEMYQVDAEDFGETISDLPKMKPDQYLLLADEQDRDAAHRWNLANQIRKGDESVRDKILSFFRQNVGKPVTSEELRYVAGNATEWARRTRELRTEDGWPVITKNSGDPTLPIGVYVLERDQQAPEHDRHISELVRREVMRRDNASCQWKDCGWPNGWPESDRRFLEVHHIEQHAHGGSNEAENLVTLCNLHHDEVHRTGDLKIA